MDDVSSGVIAAHGHHVYVGRGGDFDGHQATGIDFLDPVHVLFVVFHGVNAVEGERRK
jgi:hypothetical protein